MARKGAHKKITSFRHSPILRVVIWLVLVARRCFFSVALFRKLRRIRWIATTCSLVIFAVWMISFWVTVEFQDQGQQLELYLEPGRVRIETYETNYLKQRTISYDTIAPDGTVVCKTITGLPPGYWVPGFRIRRSLPGRYSPGPRTIRLDYGHWYGTFPLYLPFVLIAIISAYAHLPILLRRSRQMRGECAICAYNLRGNLSGRCPECGTAIGDSNSSATCNESGR